MNNTQKKWFSAAMVRALRTMAQTAIATIGSAAILSEVSWLEVASASLLAGIVSMLMSMAGLPEVKSDSKGIRYVSDADEFDEDLTYESIVALDEGDGTVTVERDDNHGTD